MISDIFMNLDITTGSAPYADDGAIWAWGRDSPSVLGKIEEAIGKIEQWSYNWGFKLSTSLVTCSLQGRKGQINRA